MSLCESCPKALKYSSLQKKRDGSYYKVPIQSYYCQVEDKQKNSIVKKCKHHPVKNPITQFLESQQIKPESK